MNERQFDNNLENGLRLLLLLRVERTQTIKTNCSANVLHVSIPSTIEIFKARGKVVNFTRQGNFSRVFEIPNG